MIRITIIIALLVALATVSRLGMRLLEPAPVVAPPVVSLAEEGAPPVEPETSMASYYPAVPQALPDLSTGYLFTETRSVAGEGEGAGAKGALEKNGEPEVDIYSIVYIGSVISGNIRKAIISAPPPKEAQSKVTGRAGRVAGSRRAAAQARTQEYARVTEGEIFRGYKVKLVSPDKIVFERGEEIVERLLYDPAKKRAAGPPVHRGSAVQSGSVSVPTPPPTPERPVLPEPSESRHMMVGGPDNIVAEPQQPTAIIRRSPRTAVPEGETQPQGVLLERPPR